MEMYYGWGPAFKWNGNIAFQNNRKRRIQELT
jgi:hypothetical protein